MDYKCLINLLRRAPNTNIGMTSEQPLEWDAADAITDLLIENHELRNSANGFKCRAEAAEARVEKLEKEKDTAINDLRVCSIEGYMQCQYFLYYKTAKSFCWNCTDGTLWKYRGKQED